MHNVLTFLWRTLYIQAVLRHYLFTGLELGMVGLLFYTQLKDGEYVRALNAENEEVPVDSAMRPFRPLAVVYGPSTTYNNKLMEGVVAELESFPQDPNLDRFKKKDKGDSTAESGGGTKSIEGRLFEVRNVTSADKVLAACRKTFSRLRENYIFYVGKGLLCVELHSDDASPNLEHTVYAPTPIIGAEITEYPLGSRKQGEEDIILASKYQYVIEKTHLQLQQEKFNKHEKLAIKIQDMPGWVFGNVEGDAYRGSLGKAITLGFLFPLIRRINAIEVEFSAGLAEHQGVMGLSGIHFLLGHFLTIMTYEVMEGGMFLGMMYLYAKKSRKAYAESMNLGVMLTSLGIFHINHALFIIFISWIFPTGWAGIIVAIVITVVLPYMTGIGSLDVSVAEYMLQSRWHKLLSAFLPHTGLASALRIAFMARDFEDKTGWSVVTDRVLEVDSVTILQIWLLMVFSGVAMTFLAWYLSKVLPWSTDNVQSPIFFLKASYWKPVTAAQASEDTAPGRDPARFEEAPPNVRPVIVVRNLTKMFGQKSALSGLNLEVYESKVTVLLGHNGAGKTTLMSILTGIKGPTSGVARVYGYDAATCRDDIRKIVSFCQQTDIFFEDLSCTENLMYFGSLKGSTRHEVREAIKRTLKVVNLEDKAYNMPRQLSGGMKRRLSLAIALVSNPKLVILDEPTTGLDPETRRNVWDAIQIVGKQHTILLSSHDMEEADAIGQHIIIMSSGINVGSGSTAFLKKACGVGYKIALMKAPSDFNLEGALAEIRKTVPLAEVEADKQGEATIALKTLDITGFPAMFKALEQSSKQLGIATIGVTVASMKDVYLKVNQDWAPGGKEREEEVNENDIAGVCQVVASGTASSVRCLAALFAKRTVCMTRSWGIAIVGLVIPLVLLLLTVHVLRMPSSNVLRSSQDKVTQNGTLPVEVRLGVHFPDSQVFFKESPASTASKAFKLLVEAEGGSVYGLEGDSKNATEQIRAIALEDFGLYMRTYPMAAVFEQNWTRGMPNPTSVMTLPVLLNMVHTAHLRLYSGQAKARIQATLSYLGIESESFQFILDLMLSFASWSYWAFLPAFSYALAFAAFAAFPVAERLGGARDVQLMTGISGCFFTLAHLFFDMICYAAVMVPWCIIHFWFSGYSGTMLAAMIVSFIVFGPAAICIGYLMAERAETVGGAVSSMVLLFYVGGFMSVVLFGIVNLFFGGQFPRAPFMLFPPYALIACLVKISQGEDNADKCEALRAGSPHLSLRQGAMSLWAPHADLGLPRHKVVAAVMDGLLDQYKPKCDVTTPFSFDDFGILSDLLFFLVDGLLCFVAMSYILSGAFFSGSSFLPGGRQQSEDSDVEEERALVNWLCQTRNFGGYALVAWNLHKRYDEVYAVRGVSLALRPAECFGLLGVNGAGKTTTFEMLAGLTNVSYGEAYMMNIKLGDDVRAWQSNISYCFQSGGLLDRMNAYEYLYLIGRLRGIPERDLKLAVDSVISVADLQQHASKECGLYSGGNRRKLAIGAALLGLRPVVCLDEPFAGVDVVSRAKICRAIAAIKQKSRTAFMLTSHNMDECEASCDRLTIMVKGKMMCLGTLQHIREKHGKGYRLHFMLKHGASSDADQFVVAVPKLFPGITLSDRHENVFSYHLVERLLWSELFTRVRLLEKDFTLEYAMIGNNTLEHIFIAFAKAQGSDQKAV